MSSPTASGQLTKPSQDIFVTPVTQFDGKKTFITSAHRLSDTSIRVNTKNNLFLLLITIGIRSLPKWNDPSNSYLELSVIKQLINYRGMNTDVWSRICDYVPTATKSVADYTLSIGAPSLFKKIEMNPSDVVDAAMRGQEDMVINILNADPSYLLKQAEVNNSVGVEYFATPLQAAIMADDVQLIVKMKPYFERLTLDLENNSIDGLAEMQRQIKKIYTESLKRYHKIQNEKLTDLKNLGSYFEINLAQQHHDNYLNALESDDINQIIQAHKKAQEHNWFIFLPYINAISNASELELDNVMALINAKTPEDTATIIAKTGVGPEFSPIAQGLVATLNQFREEFVQHMQQEIIFNPNHILDGLARNDSVSDTMPHAQDPDYKIRSIIWSQLVGWAQRNAPEPVKQDIRQGISQLTQGISQLIQGTSQLTQRTENRTRQTHFNSMASKIIRNSLVDVSCFDSSVIDGVGYKFAVHCSAQYAEFARNARRTAPIRSIFQALCKAKTTDFENLCSELHDTTNSEASTSSLNGP